MDTSRPIWEIIMSLEDKGHKMFPTEREMLECIKTLIVYDLKPSGSQEWFLRNLEYSYQWRDYSRKH